MLKLFSLTGLHSPRRLENIALESDLGKAFHANYTSVREPYGYVLIVNITKIENLGKEIKINQK